MTRALVETTGSFLLYDPQSGDVVYAERPGVVEMTGFMTARLGIGQLRLLVADLPVETTDKDFLSVLEGAEGRIELAVAAFEAEFKPTPTVGAKTKATSPVVVPPKGPQKPIAPKE